MIGALFSSIVNAIWAWWDTSERGVFDTKTNNRVISFYSLFLDKHALSESQVMT
jgi:hypothetical protein